MSGLIDKLKDVSKDALGTFVVLDEDEADAGDQTAPQPTRGAVPAAATPPPIPGPAASSSPVTAAAPDPEFVQQLKAAVDTCPSKALPKFRALYDALSAVGDPGTRTQLALSAAQASHGIGAPEVAASIDDRLKLLVGEKGSFEQAVKEETAQSVGAREAQIEKTRAEITRKIEEIKALEGRAAALQQEVAEARGSIDANAARFAASYAAVEAELAAERARVAPFLSPAKPS